MTAAASAAASSDNLSWPDALVIVVSILFTAFVLWLGFRS
jgi:Tfp pilus assembly protein PilO